MHTRPTSATRITRSRAPKIMRRTNGIASRPNNCLMCGSWALWTSIKYLNMDQVVGQALATFERINGTRDPTAFSRAAE